MTTLDVEPVGPLALAFIGFGEAAFEMCRGFGEAGTHALHAYDVNAHREPWAGLIARRVAETGTRLFDALPDLVRSASIVFSANSASVAVEVASLAAPHLRPHQIYVDLNAAGPPSMEAAAAIVEASGCRFVDAAVMGPIPRSRHRVPILASGRGSAAFRALMTPYGMVITDLGPVPGKASAVKLIRSVYMKGLAALLYEMTVVAERHGVVELVIDGVAADMDATPFMDWVTRLVCGTAVHAGRRIHEMEDVLKTLEAARAPAYMSTATLETLRWVASLAMDREHEGRVPTDFRAVVANVSERLKETPHPGAMTAGGRTAKVGSVAREECGQGDR